MGDISIIQVEKKLVFLKLSYSKDIIWMHLQGTIIPLILKHWQCFMHCFEFLKSVLRFSCFLVFTWYIHRCKWEEVQKTRTIILPYILSLFISVHKRWFSFSCLGVQVVLDYKFFLWGAFIASGDFLVCFRITNSRVSIQNIH